MLQAMMMLCLLLANSSTLQHGNIGLEGVSWASPLHLQGVSELSLKAGQEHCGMVLERPTAPVFRSAAEASTRPSDLLRENAIATAVSGALPKSGQDQALLKMSNSQSLHMKCKGPGSGPPHKELGRLTARLQCLQ